MNEENSEKPQNKPQAPKKAPNYLSSDYWNEVFANPFFTGLAASTILLLMMMIGMISWGVWFLVLLPAGFGYVINHAAKNKKPPEDDPS